MAKKPADLQLIKDGKRIDGRKFDELREVEIKLNIFSRANGSAYFRLGNTIAVASVYGPKLMLPKFLQEDKAVIVCRYNMTPFSVDERKNPAPDRRSIELSKVIRKAFEQAIFLEDFPKCRIDIFIEILQGDGSTRIASINAASLALALAGIPMRDLVIACSAGKVEGNLVVDLNGKEDNYGEADVSLAMLPSKNKVALLQMDGELSLDEIKTLLKMAKEKISYIYELEKNALKEYFSKYEG